MAARRRICPDCKRVVPKKWREEFFNGQTNCGYCGHYVQVPDPPTRVGEWGTD